MADKADIKEAFYNELVSAAAQTFTVDYGGGATENVSLDADDVSLRNPNNTESTPSVVYHDTYRLVDYNGVGNGPHQVRYNQDGSVDAEIYRVYPEAQFLVDVRASDENELEPIYDAIRRAFEKYRFGPWDKTDVNEDVWRITVDGPTSVDTGDSEQVIRGDQLDIRIAFHKDYEFSTDNIEEVEHQVDADFDGTADITEITS